MTLPPGFHAQLVVGEPDVVQPVAYTMDDRGRLWVVQNTNYPVCPGEPKDQIVIFENFGPDGKAGKKTVFYDKLHFRHRHRRGTWRGVGRCAARALLFFPVKLG